MMTDALETCYERDLKLHGLSYNIIRRSQGKAKGEIDVNNNIILCL